MPGEFKAFAAHLMEKLTPSKIVVISLYFPRRYLLDFADFLFGEHDTQCTSNALGNLILDFEDVFQFAVIALRPCGVAGSGFRELGGNAKATSGAPNAAVQDIGGPKLLANL